MNKLEPILLGRKATMRLLRVSDVTFDRLIADGIIPEGIPFGNRRRWSRDGLIAHLSRRTAEGIRSAA